MLLGVLIACCTSLMVPITAAASRRPARPIRTGFAVTTRSIVLLPWSCLVTVGGSLVRGFVTNRIWPLLSWGRRRRPTRKDLHIRVAQHLTWAATAAAAAASWLRLAGLKHVVDASQLPPAPAPRSFSTLGHWCHIHVVVDIVRRSLVRT